MIPDFGSNGVVPPIKPGERGASGLRSPYECTLLAFCQQFGTTPRRREILRGLLQLRADLRAIGVVKGFQWLDGSFLENVEKTQSRPPGDIDVVTFTPLGDLENQKRLVRENRGLFIPSLTKKTFHTDHHCVNTDRTDDPQWYVNRVAYWYSLWAHQKKTLQWKGFASVNLTSNDVDASGWLESHTGDAGGES